MRDAPRKSQYQIFHQRRFVDETRRPDDFEQSLKALPISKPRAKKKRGAE